MPNHDALRNELAQAKVDSALRVHKLERMIDLTKQRDDAAARKAEREADILAEDARLAALDAEIASLEP